MHIEKWVAVIGLFATSMKIIKDVRRNSFREYGSFEIGCFEDCYLSVINPEFVDITFLGLPFPISCLPDVNG